MYQYLYKMINNLKHELRKRPTFYEMLKQTVASRIKTTVVLKKYKKDMLLNNGLWSSDLDTVRNANKEEGLTSTLKNIFFE